MPHLPVTGGMPVRDQALRISCLQPNWRTALRVLVRGTCLLVNRHFIVSADAKLSIALWDSHNRCCPFAVGNWGDDALTL